VNISALHGKRLERENKSTSQFWLGKKQTNGISQKKGGFGTVEWPSESKVGRSGKEKQKIVYGAKKNLTHWLESLGTPKNFVTPTVKPLIIETIKNLHECEDVWCLTVPDEEHFSLSNGAVVHNCSDAFRYLAIGMDTGSTWSKPLKLNTSWIV
jgi:hypothetical protein